MSHQWPPRSGGTALYRHAVVRHPPEQPADGIWPARPARSKASWTSRVDLAQKEAAVWRKHGYETEIIDVAREDRP